jgi:hypothetical protein
MIFGHCCILESLAGCALFNKRVFDEVRFDEKYKYNYFREETDPYLRARMRDFRALYAGDYVGFHLERKGGGCHDYGLLIPPRLRQLFDKLGFPFDVYRILNNRYFLSKYYKYLRRELNYQRSKDYYELAFVLHLLNVRLREAVDLVRPLSSGSASEDLFEFR